MKIAPSILTADFTKLKKELETIETADYIHVDIMDGNFVPNISFGPAITKQISQNTKNLLDIHLMVLDPLKWIDGFTFSNTEYITVHYESNNLDETIKKIKQNKVKVGISIKPETDKEVLLPYLKDIDLVLVMSVEPGFGGQKFMASSLDKMQYFSELKKKNNYNYEIEVDGGVNLETGLLCAKNGATILVAGSYLFNMEDRKKGIEGLACLK
ncbi:Ribulose-phosphate 3-epimerase [Alteracholeplasma palmae J233]|uniref:Ribulose-phosphate 3-epimerase n=1 Tax=Alteracholeplasma palmae (strain ATCC 49389 / J233) TaxID=1318466 RepID=U4KP52_ALTPJ|nr:ribulose-phosphate 3-epimerase [Alteracholeplasma palmae]CCV63985.1 Ribulose-phosphate 3-epimerase [Alteracholeplasma palmae J233]